MLQKSYLNKTTLILFCQLEMTTDEEMFEFLLSNPDAFTIKVGNGDTLAKYKLAGINDVVLLLKHLSV